MALRRMESFDHLTTQAQLITKGWAVSGTITLEAAQGRRGTSNIRMTGSNGCTASRAMAASHASGVVGLALSTNNVNTGFDYVQILDSGGVAHLALGFDASGRLQVRRGSGGTILATGTTPLSINTYYYVEMKFTIDDASGLVKIRLNGSGSDELSFSGDARNGGLASWLTLRLHGQTTSGTSPDPRFDDIYMCDGVDSTGSHGIANNDFLGDFRCDAQIVQADAIAAGSHADFTPSAGSDHGAMVDEASPNDDTDYNASSTVGHKDSYQIASLSSAPVTIFGAQVSTRARKTDAGAREIANLVVSGGNDYNGAQVALSTSYLYYQDMFESDPDTGLPWTAGGITDLQAGLEVKV